MKLKPIETIPLDTKVLLFTSYNGGLGIIAIGMKSEKIGVYTMLAMYSEDVFTYWCELPEVPVD